MIKRLRVVTATIAVFVVTSIFAFFGFYFVVENFAFEGEVEVRKFLAGPDHLITAPWVFFGVPILVTAVLVAIYTGGTTIWFRIACLLACCIGLWIWFSFSYGEIGVLSALDLKALIYINAFVVPCLLFAEWVKTRAGNDA